MAYNEEENIANILTALEKQVLSSCSIDEIIVVSSGSTDRTDSIVKEFAKNKKITLISQPTREGKASAINLFLSKSKGDIVVLESADTLPAPEAIEKLVSVFNDPKIGMAGGRPHPVDKTRTFMGYCTQYLWWMHHQIASKRPKLGEMVAFRNIVKEIPVDTAVDEACIEAIICNKGFKTAYVPEAVVKNKGPGSISDFLKQRRRISAGHYHLHQTQNYAASSLSNSLIVDILMKKAYTHVRHTLRMLKNRHFKRLAFYLYGHSIRLVFAVGSMALEAYGRLLGMYDFKVRNRNPYKWDIASSTKKKL